jgi:hypothetical protein
MALFPARRGVRGAGRGARKYRTLGLLEDDEREHRLNSFDITAFDT